MNNLFTSLSRTVVPVAAGLVITLAAQVGLDLDSESVTAAVTSAFTAGYYAVFRGVEEAALRHDVGWLRTLSGVLLGWARPPQYNAEPAAAGAGER